MIGKIVSEFARIKRNWSFVERDCKLHNHVSGNPYALKIEKQCIYCRNFKRRQIMIKRLHEDNEIGNSIFLNLNPNLLL